MQTRDDQDVYPIPPPTVKPGNWPVIADHTTEDSPICDTASRVAAVMVSKMRVNAAAYFIELFVHTLVVFQTTPNRDSGLVTSLRDPLRPCL
ncbi:hypothetical protein TNCV_4640461 [Trichonephila clavipes]|nr:hypothetical protein TNCV_4640461 [Trichonephila clavipes]